jgi:putative MATE family efflux protein
MMVFTSIYGVVDGLFVSNVVGKTPFAAVNFIMPVLMIVGAIGFMFGMGGSALVVKTMGEQNPKKANELFSLFVYVTAICGVVLGIFTIIFLEDIAILLSAEGQMLQDCVLYGRVVLIALPFYMLQYLFQSFFITAEKPNLGLTVTVISGVTNMIFDALFIALFRWGLVGAALATAMSQVVGGVIPIIYFTCSKTSILKLTKCSFDGKAILQASVNGSSELMSTISMSIVSMLYNVQLYKYVQENGIAAYGVLMHVNFIFLAVFIGYSTGIAPAVSYHYGAKNTDELKSLKNKSFVVVAILSVIMFVLSEILGTPLAKIFVGYDVELYQLTRRAFFIYSFSFLVVGFSIFGSCFFTALNNGLISALISFIRTLVLQVGFVLLFPLIWELDGIWLSIVFAEGMSALITIFFLRLNKKKYDY